MAKNWDRVKKMGLDHEYTPEQIRQLKKCKSDIVYFCRNFVKIQHPVKGSIPFKVYPYQIKMLKAYQERRYVVVLSARQTGKSITSAIYLMWYAMFHKDQNILIASNKNAGAMEMISRIKHAYEELPMWLKPGITDDGWNKHTIQFENGSKIDSVATSEDSGRGKSISLLFLDEFAFVKPSIQKEFWSAILPTLSTGGSCIMTSTPNGDENLFATMWRQATFGLTSATDLEDDESDRLDFYPIEVSWDEPPGRDAKFKAQQIAQLGEMLWRQEYLCEFLSSDALLIDSLKMPLIEKEVYPPITTINDFKFWEEIKKNEQYIIGVDPSTGSGNDFSVISVFHFPSMKQIAEFRSNTMSSPELYAKLRWIIDAMENLQCTCYFSVENNGVGEGVIALYMNDETPPQFSEFVSDDVGTRLGFNTSPRVKMKACVSFKEMIENKKLIIRSSILIKEMKNYIRKRQSYEAQTGSTDDSISAVLIVIRILENIASYDQDAFNKLYTYDPNDYDLDDYSSNMSESLESECDPDGDYDAMPMLV